MELLRNERTEKSTITLEVRVTKEQFDKASDKAFAQNVKKLNVSGFRKGKIPKSVVYKMYGEGIFFEEAVNICYPEAYKKAIEESKITPIGPADIDVKDANEEGITFVMVVPVKPEMTLTAYKDLESEKTDVVKADAIAVKSELENMSSKLARIESVTRKIKKGDTVNFDFEGSVDGVPFPGGKADGFDLVIGSGQFIPGFEDQLIGKKSEEEVDVTVTFPEEYHAEELAGKPAIFKCKVNNVKQTILPKIDDEFAKDVSEFETLEDLKKDISDKIIERSKEMAEREFEEKLLDVLIGNLEGEIPECMFEEQTDRVVEDFAYRIQMQGMKLEDYLKMNGMDIESFRKLFTVQAVRQVKVRLALEEVIKAEGITVTDEIVEEEISKMAESYGIEVAQVKASIPVDSLKRDLEVNKALEFVRENAKVIKVKKTKKIKKDEAVSE